MKKQTGRREARGGKRDEKKSFDKPRGERKDSTRTTSRRSDKDERRSYDKDAGPRQFKRYAEASKSEPGWTKPDGKPLRKRKPGKDEKPAGERRAYERRSSVERSSGFERKPFNKERSEKTFGERKRDDFGFEKRPSRSFSERKTDDSKFERRSPGKNFGERTERKFDDRKSRSDKPFERRSREDGGSSERRSSRSEGKPGSDTRDFISGGRGKASSDRGEKSGFERKPRAFDKDSSARSEGTEKRSYTRREDGDAPRSFERRSSSREEGTEKRSYTRREDGDAPRSFERRSSSRKEGTEKRSYTRRDDSDAPRSFERRERSSDDRGKRFGKDKGRPAERNKSFRKSGVEDDKPFGRFASKPGRSERRSREEAPLKRKVTHVKKTGRGSSFEKEPADGEIRLNRYIANAGICSRREADDYITAGLVSVNGEIVTELGTKVSRGDDVRYNGERLKAEKNVYVLLNKPKDYITTSDDPDGRKTVMELIAKACKERVYPVGRLDRNTTGVLLFTNDGDLAKHLTHPSSMVRKVYHVELDKSLKKNDFQRLLDGIELEDGVAVVDDVSYDAGGDKSQVGLELHSGKNRVVRRMFEAMGYEVRKLDRVVFAGLTKKDLPRGRWRILSEVEVASLKMLTGKARKASKGKTSREEDRDQLKLF